MRVKVALKIVGKTEERVRRGRGEGGKGKRRV